MRANPPPSPLHPRPAWTWAKRALLAVFLGAVAWLMLSKAQTVAWPAVWASVRAYPAGTLAVGALLALASHLVYSCYDLLGRRYTGHHLPGPQVLTVAFVSYAFNLNLGALIGGLALRYRLYSRVGLEMGQIWRVVALAMLTNWVGYAALAGSLFVFHPLPLPPGWTIDVRGLQWLGLLVWSVALAYVLLCLLSGQRQWQVRGQHWALPARRLAVLQVALGLSHWLLLTTLMHTLMPAGLDWPSVATVLLLAAIAGVLTHVPAGWGVLEAVFFALLGHRIAHPALLAALLTYRLIYYLAPLALATVLYGLMEMRSTRANTGRQQAAGQL